ncbi:alpha/beta hydrolase domain-containing protein [Sinorhizobium meliloti]|uniref:alpha/beta hydrolase domain-containing protein n=1 Tax=Rhizobium meliloti TaxID=382 RepID=UPI003B3B5D38
MGDTIPEHSGANASGTTSRSAPDGFRTKGGRRYTLFAPANDRGLGGIYGLGPSVDDDGNECDGVKAPMAEVPLGTYTGWNILKRGNGHGAISWLTKGSYIPFPDTPDEKQTTRDPRKSVLERYGSSETYVRNIRAAPNCLFRSDS